MKSATKETLSVGDSMVRNAVNANQKRTTPCTLVDGRDARGGVALCKQEW